MLNLREEKKLWKKGFKIVVCLDEAGRGPLAGPVVATALMIKMIKKKDFLKHNIWRSDLHNIRDSKKLTPKKREEFYKLITKNPQIEWGVGRVSEKAIDKINILEATKLAMKKALNNLEKKYSQADFLILDGNFKIGLPILQKSIIKADEKVFSCTAASIIAKVTRDRIMKRYHKKYPRYGFDKHKGYPTRYHLKTLKKYGPCQIHRKTFSPIKTCRLK